MTSAVEALQFKSAAVFGANGMIDRGLSHVGDSFRALDKPHVGRAIDAMNAGGQLAVAGAQIAQPILSNLLPSKDMQIQRDMHMQDRYDRRMSQRTSAPGTPSMGNLA